MKILIVYGTIEGHSRKIAEWIADHVKTNGNKSRVIDASALQGKLDVADHDAVMIIAPVHQRAQALAQRLPQLERGARVLQGAAGVAIIAIGVVTLSQLRL